MHRLANFTDVRACASGEVFAQRLKERSFSPEFLAAYDAFVENYGFRCPDEFDLATPRFYEHPVQFFEQLRTLAGKPDEQNSPQAVFDRAKAEREKFYQELLQVARRKGRRKVKLFSRFYKVLVALGGYREVPKYHFILTLDLCRKRVMTAAQSLLENDRLDNLEQVFDLTIDDLDRGLADQSIDFAGAGRKEHPVLKKTATCPRIPPRHRFRVARFCDLPRKEAREGEILGEPISPGIVYGPVRVLNRPEEKAILAGEIMVARATDPGWTPLFINGRRDHTGDWRHASARRPGSP